MPRKILFIVNPNSGKKISEQIVEIIRRVFPENIYYHVAVWKNKDHFDEITSLLKTQGYTDAIAVGGDGTVNQVAKAILNTPIALGIIPAGSGNGLARTLGISMDTETAIKQIERGNYATIDHGTVNGIPFFCTSGVGFDAHIGKLFATSVKRGLKSYVKITVRELLSYRANDYILRFDGKEIKRKAFLITVANAGQYGNDFYIAPGAKMDDGLFHVAILKPFNAFKLPGLMTKILRRKAHLSASIETFATKRIQIVRQSAAPIHFDGEPTEAGEEVLFEIHPLSLKAIVGDKFIVS